MSRIAPSGIVVAGGAGRLGRALAGLGCRAVGRKALDITDEAAVARLLDETGAQCVINAAAYTAVDAAEADEARADAVNAFGAGCVARAAARLGLPCIQISTDCVFGDGDPAAPVQEDAQVDPLSVYGLTKYRGERAVLEAGGQACIARVAWLFDDGADTFIGKMLNVAKTRNQLSIVDDEWGRPTPVAALAAQLLALAELMVFEAAHVPEVLHLGPPTAVNRYDWAKRIFSASAALGGPSPRLEPISAEAFPTPARRPRGLVLDTSRADDLLGPMPDWGPYSDAAVAKLLA